MGCAQSSGNDEQTAKEGQRSSSQQPSQQSSQQPSQQPSQQQGGQAQFCSDALKAHNTYRAKHGAPPMTLNQELCKQAADYAKKLAEANDFKHSSGDERRHNGTSVGENLAMNYGSGEPSGSAATKMWYDEVEKYDYNNPGFTMGTGHFTQVVWKGSTELGIGYHAVKDDQWGTRIVTVGRYMPAGNMTSAFEENVTPN